MKRIALALAFLISTCLQTQAAIALVAHVNAAGPNGFTSSAIDSSGANFLIVSVTEQNAAGITISDSKSNTWVSLTEQTGVTPKNVLYYVKNATVGSGHTFTATGTGTFGVISVAAFSGVDTTSPFDLENGSFANGVGSIQPGSITPSVADSLVVTGLSWGGNSVQSIDGGFTITDQQDQVGGTNYGGGIAYLIQTSAAAANPTWTNTFFLNEAVTIASFKPGGGGPPSCTPTLTLMGVGRCGN